MRTLDPNSSRLFLSPRTDQGWDLFLSGKVGRTYSVQSRAIRGDTIWHDEYTLSLTNNSVRLPVFEKNDAGRLYRGVLPNR